MTEPDNAPGTQEPRNPKEQEQKQIVDALLSHEPGAVTILLTNVLRCWTQEQWDLLARVMYDRTTFGAEKEKELQTARFAADRDEQLYRAAEDENRRLKEEIKRLKEGITPADVVAILEPKRAEMRNEQTRREWVEASEKAFEEWGPVVLYWATEENEGIEQERDEARAALATREEQLRQAEVERLRGALEEARDALEAIAQYVAPYGSTFAHFVGSTADAALVATNPDALRAGQEGGEGE